MDFASDKTSVFRSCPVQETTVLTLNDVRGSVVVRGGYAAQVAGGGGVATPLSSANNALVRLYSTGPSGLRVEVGRGRLNGLPLTRGATANVVAGAGAISIAQAVIATRVPHVGSKLEVTWQFDNQTVAQTTACSAQFDISSWGLESPASNDDATPAEAYARLTRQSTSAEQICPSSYAFGGGPPIDSYLVEAHFTNPNVGDAFVYFLDGANTLTVAPFRVPAGGTASFTPRRPVHFLTSMRMTSRTLATGFSAGTAQAVSASIVWV